MPHNSDEPSILGSPPTSTNSFWYPNSGASHHFTHDEATLTTKAPYTGSETVKIGNGYGLYIKNVGIAIYTNPHNHCTFSLNNLFHVPHITKNLLSRAPKRSFFMGCLGMAYICVFQFYSFFSTSC